MYLSNFNPSIYEIEPNNGEHIIHINFGVIPWVMTAKFNENQTVMVDLDLRQNLDVSNAEIEADKPKLETLLEINDNLKLENQNIVAHVKTIDLTDVVNDMTITMLKYAGYRELK